MNLLFLLLACGDGLPTDPAEITALRKAPEGGPTGGVRYAIQQVLPIPMIELSAGDYTRGATTPTKFEDELPPHRVSLRPFALGLTEITQDQWVAVTAHNPSMHKGGSRPVDSVSFCSVIRFLNTMSMLDRTLGVAVEPVYEVDEDCEAGAPVVWHRDRVGYRLPTEAEWEYAARAGSTTRWSWGDDINAVHNYAWFGEGTTGQTHNVAEKGRNPWGFFDMHGNVGEWVWDWKGAYEKGPQDNPTGPERGEQRVVRGGGAWDAPDFLRSGFRGSDRPGNWWIVRGLRIAIDLPPGAPALPAAQWEGVGQGLLRRGGAPVVEISGEPSLGAPPQPPSPAEPPAQESPPPPPQ
jgi:formylglycine-generating enzyme required for sulfatase activity